MNNDNIENKVVEGQNVENESNNSKNETSVSEVSSSINMSEEIEKLKNENAELKDKFLRKVAEFENYKRRNENDLLNLMKYANENLIIDLLPILDDFERSLSFNSSNGNDKKILEGVELIYSKFQKVLEKYGLQKIDALNKEFDVNYHDALLQVPRSDVPEHTVIEEVEKGYMLKDKVIRHSKVLVSTKLQEENQLTEKNSVENSSNKENEESSDKS
ncbi:MAG: nucleotide exchange factor GrpE [Ignavibacteria bacterium]|nr:nucleotide exchange factor GrpE [Ignavibacteria bacterium]